MPEDKAPKMQAEERNGLFPFQLTAVRMHDVRAERCKIPEDKKEAATFGLAIKQSEDPPEAKEFGILLSFEGTIPSGKNESCKVSVGVEGIFKTTVDPSVLKADVIKRFRQTDSAVLLWPYLRQYVHDLTCRLDLGLPPLPVLDVRAMLSGAKMRAKPAAKKTK